MQIVPFILKLVISSALMRLRIDLLTLERVGWSHWANTEVGMNDHVIWLICHSRCLQLLLLVPRSPCTLGILRWLSLTFFSLLVIFLNILSFLGLLFEISYKYVIVSTCGVMKFLVYVCTSRLETIDHLFFECPFSRVVPDILSWGVCSHRITHWKA